MEPGLSSESTRWSVIPAIQSLSWVCLSMPLVSDTGHSSHTHKIQEHKQAKFPEAIAEACKWNSIGDIKPLLASRTNRCWSKKKHRGLEILSAKTKVYSLPPRLECSKDIVRGIRVDGVEYVEEDRWHSYEYCAFWDENWLDRYPRLILHCQRGVSAMKLSMSSSR